MNEILYFHPIENKTKKPITKIQMLIPVIFLLLCSFPFLVFNSFNFNQSIAIQYIFYIQIYLWKSRWTRKQRVSMIANRETLRSQTEIAKKIIQMFYLAVILYWAHSWSVATKSWTHEVYERSIPRAFTPMRLWYLWMKEPLI